MQSHSFSANSIAELQNKLQDCLTRKFSPTLAVVFASVDYDLTAIKDLFNAHQIDLVGASTAGEIVDGSLFVNSISVLLLNANRTHYRLFYADYASDNMEDNLSRWAALHQTDFVSPTLLIFSGGMLVNGDQVVAAVKKQWGNRAEIFGGLAGDDLKLQQTFVFDNHRVSDNGIVGLLLDSEKIEVKGLAVSGWETTGSVHTITKAEGNIVYTINDKPALDVFIRYFGYYQNVTGEVESMSAQYPLQIFRDEGYSVLRSPLVCNPDNGTLVLAGGVKNGDKFKFSVSPGFEVIDSTIDAFKSLQQQKMPAADALIMFSCKGRHASLGPLLENEISGIYQCWKAPMVGLLCYGEIGCEINGHCDLHNETCTLVVLREL